MTRARKREQRLPCVAVDRAVVCHLELIPGDVERTVKDAKNINVSIFLHEVGDSVMPVEQDANVSRRGMMAVPDFRKIGEDLCPFVNTLNRPSGSLGIICSDVLEDIFEPTLSFFSPRYCCNERMRCAICSFEIVRFASESVSPRSTMT